VLVDEFQDTNAAQYRLVKLLAAEHHNLCVVGDDDQAIYGWRGADVRHMLDFEHEHAGTRVVRLEQNYRSTQVILDAANGVIAENKERLGKTLFTAVKGGDAVMLFAAADERDEAEWIAGAYAELAAKSDVGYEGMAVLYRTNAQSRALEEALRFKGIPYRLVGAVSFYERREVKDMLAYLRLVANPADDQAFLRVINVPRRGLGDVSVALLGTWAARWGKPLLDVARHADRIPDLRPGLKDAFQGFAALIDRLRADWGSHDPASVLEEVIRAVGYEAYLADEGAEGIERQDNVEELVAGAAAWAETEAAEGAEDAEPSFVPPSAVERYLTQAALLAPSDAPDAPGVTLLTAHTAKGLEWPVVAIAGLEEGLFPLARTAGEPGGLEEERRLCYVGLTRAREKLYLSWARMRYRYGRLELGEPSRFLEAIPPRVIVERGTTPRWDAVGARRAARRAPRVEEPSWPEEESQDAPRFASGERVRHRKFGSGVVRAVSGRGRDLKVTVEFDDADVGTKHLLAVYAGLEREWESA